MESVNIKSTEILEILENYKKLGEEGQKIQDKLDEKWTRAVLDPDMSKSLIELQKLVD